MSENGNINYVLPSGWQWVRLSDLILKPPQYGLNIKAGDSGEYLYIRISDITEDGKIKKTNLKFVNLDQEVFEKYKVEENDILIARSGSVGRVYLVKNSDLFKPAVFASYLIRFKLNSEIIIPEYFSYFGLSQYYMRFIMNQSKMVSQPNINAKQYLTLFIPLPPLKEQVRIVEKLNIIMAEIEKAKIACEKQLESAEALLPAYLREIFESEKAKNWEKKKLSEVCDIYSGSSAPQDRKYFENGRYPFVRVQDLGKYGRTTNLIETKDYVNDIAVEELNLVKAEKGCILFPKSGGAITTNNRAILGIDAYVVSHLAILKPKSEIVDKYFVYYWLCIVDMTVYMENLGYPSLKLSTISNITIPLPPLKEQVRIVEKLNIIMAEIEKLKQRINENFETINTLPQAYLNKAFRGEL